MCCRLKQRNRLAFLLLNCLHINTVLVSFLPGGGLMRYKRICKPSFGFISYRYYFIRENQTKRTTNRYNRKLIILYSITAVKKDGLSSFSNNNLQIFVKLKPGVGYAQVAPKIRKIEHTETGNTNAMNSYVTLQPIERWHLYSNYVNGQDTAGFLQYVKMFTKLLTQPCFIVFLIHNVF